MGRKQHTCVMHSLSVFIDQLVLGDILLVLFIDLVLANDDHFFKKITGLLSTINLLFLGAECEPVTHLHTVSLSCHCTFMAP